MAAKGKKRRFTPLKKRQRTAPPITLISHEVLPAKSQSVQKKTPAIVVSRETEVVEARKPPPTQGKSELFGEELGVAGNLAIAVDPYDGLFPEITDIRKRTFLCAFVHLGSRNKAVQVAGVTYRTHLNWRYNDPEFNATFERAEVMAANLIEDAMFHRAVDGVPKGVYWNGLQVATERVYSDTASIFLLKGLRPERYKDRSEVQHDLSPAMGSLMTAWQELRAHPEQAHGPMPGPGEAMPMLGEHAEWMDAEIEEVSPSGGGRGEEDELAPDWNLERQTLEVEQGTRRRLLDGVVANEPL